VADLDQLDADGADGVVVRVAVDAVDDDLVLEAGDAAVGDVRQALHLLEVEPGDAGGGAEQEAGGGAAGDVARLGAGDFGDDAAGALLEILDAHVAAAGLGHRLKHSGGHA
jgi:hypothetical protein